jgi:pyrroloquinoline-quinone synthase
VDPPVPQRITFHDRPNAGEGGPADWLLLADAVWLSRAEMLDGRHVLRGVRFAVDAYPHFCLTRPWIEGVAAALTELFSPELMAARVAARGNVTRYYSRSGFRNAADRKRMNTPV